LRSPTDVGGSCESDELLLLVWVGGGDEGPCALSTNLLGPGGVVWRSMVERVGVGARSMVERVGVGARSMVERVGLGARSNACRCGQSGSSLG
jgi:hypothetical protein